MARLGPGIGRGNAKIVLLFKTIHDSQTRQIHMTSCEVI